MLQHNLTGTPQAQHGAGRLVRDGETGASPGQIIWAPQRGQRPRIGGPEFRASPSSGFGANLFSLPRPRPRRQRAIYVAGSPALSVLAAKLGSPIYQIGTCSPGQVAPHVAALGASSFASACAKRYGIAHGWETWFPVEVATRRLPSAESPVHCGALSLIVALPDGLSDAEFDTAFYSGVRKGGIDQWPAPSRQGHNSASLLNSGSWKPDNDANSAHAFWPEQVSGPVAFSPGHSSDGDRLVAFVEKVLLDFEASCLLKGDVAA